MAPKNKTNKVTLEGELQTIKNGYNSFSSRMSFMSGDRTYGEMARAFNVVIKDFQLANRKIIRLHLDVFKKTREQIIYEKHRSKRYVRDKTTEQDKIVSEILQSSESNSVSRTSNGTGIIREDKIENTRTVETESNNGHTNEPFNDYGFNLKYPDQSVELITDKCNQPLAAQTLWANLNKGLMGQWLLAPPGIGKTYILGSVIKNFIEQGWIKNKCNSISPWPILYVTKASVVEQTRNVLKDEFHIDVVNTVHVVNIELLRSSLGKLFVSEKVRIEMGKEVEEFKWNPFMHPCLIIWDECQQLARDVSTQSKIAQAVNDIGLDFKALVFQIGASATPISRVSEGKHFACSTGKSYAGEKITNKTWKRFASIMAGEFEPEDYEEEPIKRFMEFFDDCIVRVKDIKLKYKSFVSTTRLTFSSREEQEEYDSAWDRYQVRKAKIEGNSNLSASQSAFAQLAEFTIFRKAAEKIRRYHLVDFVLASWAAGKAPALGLGFKGTMVAVYKILVEDHGWVRDDVSFIWGGSTESLSAKQKLGKQMKDKGLDKILAGLDISMEDIGIDMFNLNEKTNEQYEFEKAHRLLSQKPEEREKERLNFQRQSSRLLLFSFKAGGTGLSAHHESKYPNSRPREGLFSPIYSEKEMIQAFGRLPRITSASDTYQNVGYYGGTIETSVMARLIMKLKCARHVGQGKESWESIITGKDVPIADRESIDIPDVDDLLLDNQVVMEKEL